MLLVLLASTWLLVRSAWPLADCMPTPGAAYSNQWQKQHP